MSNLDVIIEKAELPKHKNPLPPFIQTKADNKVEPYKKINAIIIPDNATNGDMIKAMFNVTIKHIYKEENTIITILDGKTKCFDLDWWNAPYKLESEGEE